MTRGFRSYYASINCLIKAVHRMPVCPLIWKVKSMFICMNYELRLSFMIGIDVLLRYLTSLISLQFWHYKKITKAPLRYSSSIKSLTPALTLHMISKSVSEVSISRPLAREPYTSIEASMCSFLPDWSTNWTFLVIKLIDSLMQTAFFYEAEVHVDSIKEIYSFR